LWVLGSGRIQGTSEKKERIHKERKTRGTDSQLRTLLREKLNRGERHTPDWVLTGKARKKRRRAGYKGGLRVFTGKPSVNDEARAQPQYHGGGGQGSNVNSWKPSKKSRGGKGGGGEGEVGMMEEGISSRLKRFN